MFIILCTSHHIRYSWHQYFFVSEKSNCGGFGIPVNCMITHEKYLSLSSKTNNEAENDIENWEWERQDIYFHSDITINQASCTGSNDSCDEKNTATCPLHPQDVWSRFFELCDTISKAKTSTDIQSSILILHKTI